MDLKPVIDAGVLGLLVYIVFLISSKADKMIDAHQKLLTQLIEIIGREAVKRTELARMRYEEETNSYDDPPTPL